MALSQISAGIVLEPAASLFQRNGFCLTPPVLPRDLVGRVNKHMDAVIAGEYETGEPPRVRNWNPGDDPAKLRKIDQPHLADRTIRELVTHPAIGQWAAGVTGARMIQVWAVQLLFKPPGGEAQGNVGWHQDKSHWSYWDGEVFTCWVATSDVGVDSGPVLYVRGSHRWGRVGGGNFYDGDLERLRREIDLPVGETWEEVPALLPSGALSFHHSLTIHGSGPNRSSAPRRGFALHLRTENSAPAPGATHYFVSHLDDPALCPVIYRA